MTAALGEALPDVAVRPPGPASRALMERLAARECPAFEKRREDRAEKADASFAPIVLARGEGANVWDADDNRYVDLAAGFGSVLLGHGAPAVARAIERQSRELVQGLGDLYASAPKVALVERLARIHPDPGARVILCQSGADAITAALKTAALATERHGVVAFEGGYHGLGYAPLAACGYRESYREPFAPELNPAVRFAPYPKTDAELDASLARVRSELAEGDVAAVLVEPILGRGGVVVPPRGFLRALGELAREAGALLVADEIWTGLGRSGAMLRSIADGAGPDVVCLGKGLGGGLSISACIGSAASMAGWRRSGEVVHTSTHAGAPLPSTAALAVLGELDARALAARADAIGRAAVSRLAERARHHASVREVRGAGLMIGVELASGRAGLAAMQRLLEEGFLVTTGGREGEVVVLTPPLTVTEAQLDAFGDALERIWKVLP